MNGTDGTRGRSTLLGRQIPWGVATALLCSLIGGAPAAAYPRPGLTGRVSVGTGGTQGTGGHAGYAALSGDGRLVVFQSEAKDLVPGDTNNWHDVFVHDRQTDTTERVSLTSGGNQFAAPSVSPAISADGRYVAFMNLSFVTFLYDLYVHDRVTGSTELISASPAGAPGNGHSGAAALSADGRYVAYHSKATNLVPGDTGVVDDIFVYDRQARTTDWVSRATDGAAGDDASLYSAISADGRFVTYQSLAANLVPQDSNESQDVFVRDRQLGTTELVSVATGGAQVIQGASMWPAISADGRFVSFSSTAWNLVPGDTNTAGDVFVRDLVADTTERISVASSGAQGDGGASSWGTGISADGRSVAFSSAATNLGPGDASAVADMYVHDRLSRTTERVSVTDAGELGNSHSSLPSFSADGRFVAFVGPATNLVPGDTNGFNDVFVRDRGPAPGTAGLTVTPSPGEAAVSGFARFPAAELARVQDAPADGEAPAESVGGEIVSGDVLFRPEEEDLQVRIGLASLPGPLAGGSPGVVYGLAFTSGGQSYEVRAHRAAVTAVPPGAPVFALFQCQPACAEIARLVGGIGVRGLDVLVSIPASLIGATPGASIGGLRVYTALGEAGTGALRPLDEVALGAAVIPAPRVHVGIAPAATPEEQVPFDVEASLVQGRFSALLPTGELPPGEHRVWARACLGVTCAAHWALPS